MTPNLLFIIGLFVSRLGDAFSMLAFLLLLGNQSQSAVWASLYLVGRYLPSIVIGFFFKNKLNLLPKKKALIYSYLGSAATLLLCIPFTHNRVLMILTAFGLGVFYGIYVPLQRAVIPDVFSKSEIRSANTIVQTTDVIAKTIGFALAGLLLNSYGIEKCLLLDALSFVLIAGLFSKIKISKIISPDEPLSINIPFKISKEGLAVFIIIGVTWLGTGAMFSLEALYAQYELKCSSTQIGVLFAVSNALILFTRPIINWIPRSSHLFFLELSCFMELSIIIAYSLSVTYTQAILCSIGYGFFLNIRQILGNIWIHETVSKSNHSAAFSYQQAVSNLFMITAMSTCGLVANGIGTRYAILTYSGVAMVMITTLMIYRTTRRLITT
ncbi:MAG: MFS transporter [Xanthomonadaceae bacterium]|nr:MFS transporter [Xanthomonadaceae bacterium]